MFGRRNSVFLVILISISGCGSPQRPVETFDTAPLPSQKALAFEAERRGDWPAAASHWERTTQSSLEDKTITLALVRALRLSGACGRAAPYLSTLLSNHGSDFQVLLETGKCHLVSGRLDAAVSTLDQAIEAGPMNWEAETVMATALDHLERPHDALVHHDRALELAPGNAIILSNKAISLALDGKLDLALTLMREASAKPDAISRVRLNLAFLEAISGNMEFAALMAEQEIAGDGNETIKLLKRIGDAAQVRPLGPTPPKPASE